MIPELVDATDAIQASPTKTTLDAHAELTRELAKFEARSVCFFTKRYEPRVNTLYCYQRSMGRATPIPIMNGKETNARSGLNPHNR